MFGQLVIGPPGAGKSTYCAGLQQFFAALGRPVAIINLDPACPSQPYEAAISIASLITLEDVMRELQLGPNGGMLYCLEYLEANFDWLQKELGKLKVDYVVFDLPGQVELSTDHMSLRRIVERLEKLNIRLAAVHLTDAHHITDASKFVSVLLLALRTMLQLQLPHINVLSKVDLLTQYGDLPFNLDFYTEVQDLSFLETLLDREGPRSARFAQMNRVICDLVEDFGLVGFETLCVEDKASMATLVKAIDSALGYVAPAEDASTKTEYDPSQLVRNVDPRNLGAGFLQERWIDQKEEYDEADRKLWADEGIAAKTAKP